MRQITIKVPGTSANLGPGFDCLGIAFQIYNHFRFSWRNIEDTVSPHEQYERLAITPSNQLPMMDAYVKYAELFDLDLPLVESIDSVKSEVPVARGLGSSATCYVSGARAAQFVAEQLYTKKEILREIDHQEIDPFSKEAVLAVAATIERHPDNLCPCVFGGLRVASVLSEQGLPRILEQELAVHENIRFIVSYPDFSVKTTKARSILPEMIPRRDAIFNLSALAFLVKGFETGSEELLAQGLQDQLHQPYRATLIQGFNEILAVGREAGAAGSVLSGAGPTILTVYVETPENKGKILPAMQSRMPANWHIRELSINFTGAEIEN